MDRFDKFTDRARKVLTFAQDESQRFKHNYIGTEHILLGLLRVDDGVAAQVLDNLNVELPKVRAAVVFIIGRGDRPIVGEIGLTPRAKRVIELAIEESRRLEHNYVGTEHLLLGLVREGEGIAAGVLESLGVNLDKVRHEVIRVVGLSPTEPPGSSWGPMTIVPSPASVDEATRALALSKRYLKFQTSALLGVIGVGQVATEGGVSVELLAVEIRKAGCVIYWKAHGKQVGLLGEPQLAVTDDADTDYIVLSIGAIGSEHVMKGEVLVVPGPPDGASMMTVDLSLFSPRPPSVEDGGSGWHFVFAIRG